MLTCFTFKPTVSFRPTCGGWQMGNYVVEYRVYLVDSDGHFYDAVHLTCATDAEAIEKAKGLAVDCGVELWQLDRKVAAFPDQNRTP
jgi:hypothetical protein